MHYNYHRYYDPSIGRYTTPDPIGLDGGLNLYSYALNNTLILIDPWGLKVIYLPGVHPPNDPKMIKMLDKLDAVAKGKDVYVTEGQRPEDAKYGAEKSFHKTGQAADVYIPGLTTEQTAALGVKVGFDGISTYDKQHGGHTHVDIRGYEWNGHNSDTIRGLKPLWREQRNVECPTKE